MPFKCDIELHYIEYFKKIIDNQAGFHIIYHLSLAEVIKQFKFGLLEYEK